MVAAAAHHFAATQASDSRDADLQSARRISRIRSDLCADRWRTRNLYRAGRALHLQRVAPESALRLWIGAVGGDLRHHLRTSAVLRAWARRATRGRRSVKATAKVRS